MRRLEVRLTETQSALRDSSDELQRLQQELVTKDQEIQSIRAIASSSDSGGVRFLPASETLRTWGAATDIEINSMLTGVRSGGDGQSSILQVVAQPVDEDGTSLKVPGRLTLEILDPEADSDQRTVWLGEWQPEEARDAWEEGFLATGYTLKVPLSAFRNQDRRPASEHYLLIVKQYLADGREFTDSTEITIAADSGAAPSW